MNFYNTSIQISRFRNQEYPEKKVKEHKYTNIFEAQKVSKSNEIYSLSLFHLLSKQF